MKIELLLLLTEAENQIAYTKCTISMEYPESRINPDETSVAMVQVLALFFIFIFKQ